MKTNLKKLLAALFAGALLLGTFTACNMNATGNGKKIKVEVGDFTPGTTSIQQANNMAIGWNLGNTLDANDTGTKANKGVSEETAWSLPKTTESMIKDIHDAGFKTIRIPVSWHNHITDADGYKIDSAWMKRVKEIVDWAYNDGMCVILNIHHDNMSISNMSTTYGFALADKSTNTAVYNASIDYITSIWSQIAEVFNDDYDNRLVFEVLNEPRDKDGEWKGNEWWCISSDVMTCLKEYEKAAIDTIRASGGNNLDRFIMVPAYAATGTDTNELNAYGKLPSDSSGATADRLIFSTHAYSPYNFAMYSSDDPNHTAFTSDDKSSLDSIFSYLNTNYGSIGIVMGEASASDKNNSDERKAWAAYYFNKAAEYGIPVVLWDNMVTLDNGGSLTSGECHGWYNRNAGTWYFPDIITTMMKAVYGDSFGTTSGGDDGTSSGGTGSSSSETVIFDASTASSAPSGTEIVTLDGVKYLKVTPNKYDTHITVTSTAVTKGQTLTVTMRGDSDNSSIQAVVKLETSTYGAVCAENTDPTMNPLSTTAKGYTSTITTSATVTMIQPMVQNTSDWSARDDTAIYISKISVK